MMYWPSFEWEGNHLSVGGNKLELQGRDRTRALLEAFVSEGSSGIRRDELRRSVYREPLSASQRLRDAQNSSLTKLISRTRRLLRQSVAGTGLNQGWDWLSYCPEARRWHLARPKSSEWSSVSFRNECNQASHIGVLPA